MRLSLLILEIRVCNSQILIGILDRSLVYYFPYHHKSCLVDLLVTLFTGIFPIICLFLSARPLS